jgi:hypothetical protein
MHACVARSRILGTASGNFDEDQASMRRRGHSATGGEALAHLEQL